MVLCGRPRRRRQGEMPPGKHDAKTTKWEVDRLDSFACIHYQIESVLQLIHVFYRSFSQQLESGDLWPPPAASHCARCSNSGFVKIQHAQEPSCTHTSTCVCTSTCARHPFVWAFVLPFLLFPWLRVWKWLLMRSTSLAWEQKQCGEHIITSQRKTESCLPVCLRCCIRTFSASAATAVSRGQRFLQEEAAAEPGGAGARKHRRAKKQTETEVYYSHLCYAKPRVCIRRGVNIPVILHKYFLLWTETCLSNTKEMKVSIAVQNKATANHVMDINQYLYKQVEHKVIPTIHRLEESTDTHSC